jgi:phosphoribosyl 1,2-cyclic phosphodiesterase
MSLRFTILASGSGGNAALVETDEFGILIDLGLGPRQLATRLAAIGRNWTRIRGVVLTHTHGDHWKDRSLAHLRLRNIPFYCHPAQAANLRTSSPAFFGLAEAGLIHTFEAGDEIFLGQGLRCRPFPVCHDAGPTFGFRFEGASDLFGGASTLAYAADLGCWDEETVHWLTDADLVALEFNHDPHLERCSGRSPHLIARVLGDEGHLSNPQAAGLLRAVLNQSNPGRLRHLVQLHLSRDCNRTDLAQHAAREVLDELAPHVSLITAQQDFASPTIHLSHLPHQGKQRRPRSYHKSRPRIKLNQPRLPGLDLDS